MKKINGTVPELRDIISRLRAPDGCPWDREQTPFSVKKYIVEEAYELLDAIDQENASKVAEELGDLLFMLLFVCSMYEEQGKFDLQDVLRGAAEKMVRRHPHIFAGLKISGTDDVIKNWQAIKSREAADKGEEHSVLGNLPRSMPALQRAFRLGERASRVGFDWEEARDVLEKLNEETEELRDALKRDQKDAVGMEIGDLLFTLANFARKLGINPEETLQDTNNRFVRRFHAMERGFAREDRDLASCSLDEMNSAWEHAKNEDG